MSSPRTNRLATLALAAALAALVGERAFAEGSSEPSVEALRGLVTGYAHAIETNNQELALWYVHPRSPRRSEMAAALRDQLGSYLERARTSDLARVRAPDGTASAKVEQEIIRVFGMKLTRGTRHSIYHFREFQGSWRIWGIDEAGAS